MDGQFVFCKVHPNSTDSSVRLKLQALVGYHSRNKPVISAHLRGGSRDLREGPAKGDYSGLVVNSHRPRYFWHPRFPLVHLVQDTAL